MKYVPKNNEYTISIDYVSNKLIHLIMKHEELIGMSEQEYITIGIIIPFLQDKMNQYKIDKVQGIDDIEKELNQLLERYETEAFRIIEKIHNSNIEDSQ